MSTPEAQKMHFLLKDNEMKSLEEVTKELQDRNTKMVAKKTGIGYRTVLAVKKSHIREFSYDTIKRISDYLEQK